MLSLVSVCSYRRVRTQKSHRFLRFLIRGIVAGFDRVVIQLLEFLNDRVAQLVDSDDSGSGHALTPTLFL